MSSILEAQIDFLGKQVGALPSGSRSAVPAQIEEVVAVPLAFFDQIVASAGRTGGELIEPLITHWLRSARAILPQLRELKSRGQVLPHTAEFVRAILKAEAVVRSGTGANEEAGTISLEEVERELQGHA